MSLGQSEGTTTSVQRSDPWSGVQPYLADAYGQAQQQFSGPQPGFFPFSTAMPVATETDEALGAQAARARAGSPLLQAAQQQNLSTVQGDYLGEQNPYLSSLFDTMAGKVQAQAESPFIGAGRYGSAAHGRGVGDALSGLAANIYMQDYGRERDLQERATLAAPSFAAADYYDPAQLGAVGARREATGREQLQDAMQRFYFEQAAPQTALDRYLAQLQGAPGGTSTMTQPIYGSPAGGALGGAVAGAGIAQMLGRETGWPFALGGAGLGLLSGIV